MDGSKVSAMGCQFSIFIDGVKSAHAIASILAVAIGKAGDADEWKRVLIAQR